MIETVRLLARACVIGFVTTVGIISPSSPAHAILANNENAVDILGQFSTVSTDTTGVYTKGCENNGGSTIGFNFNSDSVQSDMNFGGVALDLTNHYLFIGDTMNNRVVVFALNTNNTINSKTPSYVLGQPDFTSCTSNQGGATGQGTMSMPIGVAVDPANHRLFVADAGNNRVLVFSTSSMSNGMNASYELGQPSGTAFTSNSAGTTQAKLDFPEDVAYDSTNTRLFVADSTNNRVMIFNVATGTIANGENAVNELGQPSGTAYTSNTAADTQSGMNTPDGLAYDTSGTRLFVSDFQNDRVLIFSVGTVTNGMNASNVLLQSSYTTGSGGNGSCGLSKSAGGIPTGLAYDSVNSRLFVSDACNDRVLVFSVSTVTNGMNASNVLCDSSFTVDDYGTSQSECDITRGVAVDTGNNTLYVADANNNRVMIFNVATGTIANGENASDLLGQYTSSTSTTTVSYTKAGGNNGPTALGLSLNQYEYANNAGAPGDDSALQNNCESAKGGGSMDIDRVNHRLFVADSNNSRILIYNLNTDNSFSTSSGGHTADNILGRTSLTAGEYDCPAGQAGLCSPYDVLFDSANNRLFVADSGDGRVMVYDTSTVTNGMNASYELGQTSFTSSDECNANGSASQTSLCCPMGLALDSANNNLYVADTANNRVMVFNVATGSIANGENASYELGETSFTAVGGGVTQAKLDAPQSVSFDPVNKRLFVADTANNRVMVFPTASIASAENASYVLGQTSFTAHGAAATQAGMDGPGGVSYDPNSSRIYVGDTLNLRVMAYDGRPGYISNGMNGTNVLGQSSFTANGVNTTQAGFGNPIDSVLNNIASTYGPTMVRYDPGTTHLFVSDPDNNRIMIFDGTYLSPSTWPMGQ